MWMCIIYNEIATQNDTPAQVFLHVFCWFKTFRLVSSKIKQVQKGVIQRRYTNTQTYKAQLTGTILSKAVRHSLAFKKSIG